MHTMYLGQSRCGKTTLAQLIAAMLRRHKKQIVVLDPAMDPRWKGATFHTSDPKKFNRFLRYTQNAFFFIDECGKYFDAGDSNDLFWTATESRHWGHSGNFMAQRHIQIPPLLRDQCNAIHLFNSGEKDGIQHAQEWNTPELAECNLLRQYEFFSVVRFKYLKKRRIVDWKKIVEMPLAA